MKLALVHDWIVDVGGAERVLATLHHLWPQAPISTLLYRPATIKKILPNATIIASSLQRLPLAWKYYPMLAPLMPSAIETLDLSAYDTVLSSSVFFSKGIIVRPDTRHLCYCYSPTRMLWDRTALYERSGIGSRIARHVLRSWDQAAAQRPDQMLAISQTIASRIQKYYRRPSIVIPPPTRPRSVPDASLVPAGDYYLIVARMMPHKSLHLVLNAFAKLRDRLIIVGEGSLREQLARRASPNVTFTGWVSDAMLDGLYEGCRAVLVVNEEDWGLVAVEAMAHGKPVLALRRGGATESVLEGITGEFFDDPIPEALADGMKRIASALGTYDPDAIRTHAAQYGEEQFCRRMQTLVESPA